MDGAYFTLFWNKVKRPSAKKIIVLDHIKLNLEASCQELINPKSQISKNQKKKKNYEKGPKAPKENECKIKED